MEILAPRVSLIAPAKRRLPQYCGRRRFFYRNTRRELFPKASFYCSVIFALCQTKSTKKWTTQCSPFFHYSAIPKPPFISRYIKGIVIIEQIVDKTTLTDAKSLSFPYCTASIAPLVALGIENRKKTVYLIVLAIGKNATRNMVISDITISFMPVDTYAHLSVRSCLTLTFAKRIPITNIESGVTMFERKLSVFMSLVKILYPTEPTSANSTSGFCTTKNKTKLMATAIMTGFKSTFFAEISFLSPVMI